MAKSGQTGAAIYHLLTQSVDVTSLYGTRIYPNITNFDTLTYPIIVYTMTSTEPTNTKGVDGDSQLDVLQFQIALFNTSYSDMVQGQQYVREALDYVADGTYPSTGSYTTQIQSISFQDDRQDYIEDFMEQGLFVSYMNFQVRQKRTLSSPDTIMVFDTRIQGALSTPTNQLKLNFAGDPNNCVIDWGDGTTQTKTGSGNVTHTYSTPGIYKVTFSGERVSLKYDASVGGTLAGRFDAFKLLEIKNWGIFVFNTDSMFEGCINMTITATDIPTITTTSFTSMFAWCKNMTAPSTMNDWDVSLTTMTSCFYQCNKFNTYINDWDVSGCTGFQSVFNSCSLYNQDLNNWDVSSGVNFKYMFQNASNFNGDVSTWQFSTTDDITMVLMFGNASSFNQDIGNWNTINVVNMQQLLYNAHLFNQNLNSWDMDNVTTLYRAFYGLMVYDQPMDNWDVTNITNFVDFMRNSNSYSTANYDALLISWSAQDVSLNESINFGSSQYTAGGDAEAARTFLITNKGWTITDGGPA